MKMHHKNQFGKITWILFFISLQAQASETLFVVNELNDPLLADQAVGILQCVNAGRAGSWELVNELKGEQKPSLVFSAEGEQLMAKISDRKESKSFKADQCHEILHFLGEKPMTQPTLQALSPPPITSAENSPLADSEAEPQEPSFLQRNWKWLTAATVIAGGVLAYKHFTADNSRGPTRLEVR